MHEFEMRLKYFPKELEGKCARKSKKKQEIQILPHSGWFRLILGCSQAYLRFQGEKEKKEKLPKNMGKYV